ncbi:DUF4384 domain-containing protein [Spongiibacter sp. KMU-158]|uniref:DUF4384 domain-containing protein n=1 Tax=Spongiibacter pelagi TaxID=2760804 RepID=A0A927GWY9_9GAMM|nr:DUF4384 domain-containing protein [Spongiibacter pelagi]MBD2859442.1 DUF4384 domain-containing protein [Spongiibacter pelagi]
MKIIKPDTGLKPAVAGLLLLNILLAPKLYAELFTGVGIDADRATSVSIAQNDLAQQLFVQIESKSVYEVERGASQFSAKSLTQSDVALMGVNTHCDKRPDANFHCKALLDTEKARPMYQRELNRIAGDIESHFTNFEAAAAADQYLLGKQLLVKMSAYDKVRNAGAVLELNSPTNLAPIKRRLESWSANTLPTANSIKLAVKVLADGLEAGQFDVHAPYFEDSQELTPFGRAFMDAMQAALGKNTEAAGAKYRLLGRYTETKSGLDIAYDVIDIKTDALIDKRLVRLQKSAYANYEIKPATIDFDRMLRQGYAVSNDFSVLVATNRGLRNLAFAQGEDVELLVKMNKAGYFYAVGYSINEGQAIEYLLPLNDTRGDRQFIQYVNFDDANKWISLGSYTIEPPFGTESLRIIASTEDPINSLPAHRFDPSSGYFVMGSGLKQLTAGLEKTRGLKMKKTKAETSPVVESVLTFSTYQ